MYHSIVEDPSTTVNSIGLSQSRSTFDAHMRELVQHFSPVTIQQIVEFAHEGRPLPRRAVAVTFDDGFVDNYDCAFQVLMHYGIPATFYIMFNAVETGALPWYCRLNAAFRTTSKREWLEPEQGKIYKLETIQGKRAAFGRGCEIGAKTSANARENFVRMVETSLEVEPCRARLMMTWEQVRALKKAGHIIGAHTLSHPNLAHVSPHEARTEILESKKQVERAIAEPVDHFSYPHPALNPQWSLETLQFTRDAGFRSAALTTCGPIRRGDEPLALKRIYPANDLRQWIWNLECTFIGRRI